MLRVRREVIDAPWWMAREAVRIHTLYEHETACLYGSEDAMQ